MLCIFLRSSWFTYDIVRLAALHWSVSDIHYFSSGRRCSGIHPSAALLSRHCVAEQM